MGIPRSSMKQGCSLGKGKALKINYISFESLYLLFYDINSRVFNI